jgi:hypothetical protein
MTVDRLRAVLSAIEPAGPGRAGDAARPPVTARELAEILWLAAHIAEERPDAAEPPAPAAAAPSVPPPPDQAAEAPAPAGPAGSSAAPAGAGHRHRLYGPSDVAGDEEGTSATGVLVPTAPMLDHPLAVQRALRPLKRRVPSRRADTLDEEATAARIAEQPAGARPWVPVLTSSPERWLSLVLVVDVSPSMRMWRPLARELQETLIRLGAFRDLRVRYLIATARGIGVAASPQAPPRDAATMIDPSGRQVVLVLSDCSGMHWWDGRAARALRQWAQAGPAAILQPLAERLWRRTGAPAVSGSVVAARACAPNGALRFTPFDGAPGAPPDAVAVPILECAPGWLADWAALVAGAGGARPAAMTYLGTPDRGDVEPLRHERELPIQERVRRFQTTASPAAARLAAHVAVSFPALPVMRLIQHRILPDARPGHLAEVLLSGLIRPVDGDAGRAGWYDFVPGARAALLTTLPRSESWHTADVLGQISEEIERRAGATAETFRAYLPTAGDSGEHAIGPHGRPFALVSAEAVRLLSRTARPEQPAGDHLSAVTVEQPAIEPAAGPAGRWPMETVRLLELPGRARDQWQYLASAENPDLMDLRDQSRTDPLWEAWELRARDPLRVEFGVDARGVPVTLDLREAAQGGMGPHGLLAWSPGAGKAELIRTLILGLALAHSPRAVNFLLVGFGGGVTARGLDDLPHISGIVADAARTEWLAEALRRELSSRQELLRSAGGFRSHREYQEAWAGGAPLDPLPTLVVLVDEVFALPRVRPELFAALTEIGWKGRALGVHLLLAAQRIDRALLRRMEPYLSYRICLATNSLADSEAVLGNTDAFYQPRLPGHGFLKVGTAIYQRFRAAYSADDAAAIIRRLSSEGSLGGPEARRILPSPPAEPLDLDQPVTLDRLLPGLSVTAARGLAAERPADLSAVVGVVRRSRRAHEPLWLDLSGGHGNLAVAGAQQSGKSRFLGTLVASLALLHTPQEVRFYCLDFGGGLLSHLAGLPHVGDVATELDTDTATRIVTALVRLMEEREPWTGGPEIFLVVDRWRTVLAAFPDLVPMITDLVQGGPLRGIRVLLSTRAWADLSDALRHYCGVRVEMRLEDPATSLADPQRAAALPPMSGRGLLMGGEHFLAAVPRIDGQATFAGFGQGISHLVEAVRSAWPGPPAPSLTQQNRPTAKAVAAASRSPEPPTAGVALWGAPGSGKTSFLAALSVAANRADGNLKIIGGNPESTEYLSQMTNAMIGQRRFPAATAGGQDLSWVIAGATERTVGRLFRRRTEKVPFRVRLDLIDAPGRLFRDAVVDDSPAGTGFIERIARCEGLVYLFDPLGQREFQPFQRMLANIAEHCRRIGRLDGPYLPHHLAVCVTKLDDPEVSWRAERQGYATLDLNDPIRSPRVGDDQAEDLLLEFGGREIRDAVRTYFEPGRVRYFATSAVGFPGEEFQGPAPVGESRRVIRGDVRPINVLESLLWLVERITR